MMEAQVSQQKLAGTQCSLAIRKGSSCFADRNQESNWTVNSDVCVARGAFVMKLKNHNSGKKSSCKEFLSFLRLLFKCILMHFAAWKLPGEVSHGSWRADGRVWHQGPQMVGLITSS